MTLQCFVEAQCGSMDEEYQCSQKLWFRHLSVIIFTGAIEVHINGIRGINIHITKSKIHISYSENHDSTLFFNYFYISSLPTLVHIVAKGR